MSVMAKTDCESIGKRVAKRRGELDLSQSELARRVGVTPQTIQKLEAGGAKGSTRIVPIAKILRVKPDWLQTGEGTPEIEASTTVAPITLDGLRNVPLIGEVQAGNWRFTEPEEWPHRQTINVPIDRAFDGLEVYAMKVVGPSMDHIYPHGAILVCIKFLDLGRQPRHGERVIVVRARDGGGAETTVKEFRIDSDGKPRLWPRSRHPDFQAPLILSQIDETVLIQGLVIGSWKAEA